MTARERTTALGVVLVVVLAVTALWWVRYRGSDLDRFYRPPLPFAAGQPGDVVKVEPTAAKGIEGDVSRIMYHSRSLAGDDIAVTGYLAVPSGPAPEGGRPVVSLAHPSVGIADQCAPSRKPSDAKGTVNQFLARGWAVVATDYEGLGPPGRHPYLVGPSEGRSVLDAARAAQRVLGPAAGDQVLLWGHSQGGHAVLWARGEAGTYAPDLDVVGAVAVAPVGNVGVFVAATALNAPTISLMTVAGFAAAYPELRVRDVLTREGTAHLQAVDDHCLGDMRKGLDDLGVDDLIGLSPSKVPGWSERIAASDASEARSDIPVLVVQGTADPIIFAEDTQRVLDEMCDAGQPVSLLGVEGAGHGDAVDRTRTDVTSWMTDRLAGKPAGTTCPAAG